MKLVVLIMLRFIDLPYFLCLYARCNTYFEDASDDIGVDVLDEILKEIESLELVFDERVFLGVTLIPDPFSQPVHLVEMILPSAVDRLQGDKTLDLGSDFFTELLDFLRERIRNETNECLPEGVH